MSEALLTQEVGSLTKPTWRVQSVQGLSITEAHIAEASAWSERLDLDPDQIVGVLETARAEKELSPESIDAIKLEAARQAIRLQEKAGLDIIYDGEQDRPEMYQSVIDQIGGFEHRGRLLAFDDRSFLKSAVVSPPTFLEPLYLTEFKRAQALTDHQLKLPVTGPYTLANWSFNEYYRRPLEQGGAGPAGSGSHRSFCIGIGQRGAADPGQPGRGRRGVATG